MSPLAIIIISIAAFLLLFLLLREVNLWYWKINRLISLLEEQNSLLKQHLMLNGPSEDSIARSSIPTQNEKTTYSAPEIKSQNIIKKDTLVGGSIENIQVEFSDGVTETIFHKLADDLFYFKEKTRWRSVEHHYDTMQNCLNALHFFLKQGQILKIGWIGSYS